MSNILFFSELPKMPPARGAGRKNALYEEIRHAMEQLSWDGNKALSIVLDTKKQAQLASRLAHARNKQQGHIITVPPSGFRFRSSYFNDGSGKYTLCIFLEKIEEN